MEVVGGPSSATLDARAEIPGPRDRASFFEEQARNRRSTRTLAAFCAPTKMTSVPSVHTTWTKS
jgi:hypothetical protein